MSSFLITGFFGVIQGRRITVQRSSPTPKSVPYVVYHTAINFSNGDVAKHAEIRVYSSSADPILPNETVVYMVAKASFPNSKQLPVLLDPIVFAPVPGDPQSLDYDSHLPNCPFPIIIGIGSVGSTLSPLPNLSRVFGLNVSDYVCDEVRTSVIMCGFDDSKTRWSKTPVPATKSSVMVVGTSLSNPNEGSLCIKLENIVLGIGSHQSGSQDVLAPFPSSSSPAKRKFNAIGGIVPSVASTSTDVTYNANAIVESTPVPSSEMSSTPITSMAERLRTPSVPVLKLKVAEKKRKSKKLNNDDDN